MADHVIAFLRIPQARRKFCLTMIQDYKTNFAHHISWQHSLDSPHSTPHADAI